MSMEKDNANLTPPAQIPRCELPPYISSPEDKGADLTLKAIRTVSQHPDICICSGFIPERSRLYELAEQFDGVLVVFENISDELTMI